MAGKVVGGSVALAAAAAVGAVAVVAPAADEGARPAQATPLRFTTSDLFIEINATDGDAGLQVELGGRVWRRLVLRDPRGRTLLDVNGRGRLQDYGVTDMFFESNEPPFTQIPFRRFRERFPEGRYTFAGTTLNGRRLVGSDTLTHDVPKRPAITAPAADAVVAPADLTVRWEPVTRPRGIRIIRYIVIVTEQESERELSMDLSPDATNAVIPAGFFAPGAEYAVEVLARERSGNQTITEVTFTTSR